MRSSGILSFTSSKTRMMRENMNQKHRETVNDIKKYFEQLVVTIDQKEQHNKFLDKFVTDSRSYLYVTRVSNHQLVWIGEHVKKVFGNIIGQICYEAFQNLLEPCEFCIAKTTNQEEGKEYSRIYHNKIHNKLFFIIDVTYNIEGELYRFEKAIDITDHLKDITRISRYIKNGNE